MGSLQLPHSSTPRLLDSSTFSLTPSHPETPTPSSVTTEIRFERVSKRFDGAESARPAVDDVDLTIAPGELVGLVGPSGGGKSTIVNLIARFYDVTGGTVRVDGVDVRRLDSGHYRQQVGMVLQT